MKSFNNFLNEKKNGLWANIHAKRKRGEKPNPPGHPDRPSAQDFKDAQKTSKEEGYVSHAQRKAVWAARNDEKKKAKKEAVEEKTLTPAEKKKREEIAKAMERDNPGMPMAKKMAIATAQAKKVAEETSLSEERVMWASDVDPNYTKGFVNAALKKGLKTRVNNAGGAQEVILLGDKKVITNFLRARKFSSKEIQDGMLSDKNAAKWFAHAGVKEAYEDDEPASPDEASMALRQLGFIEYAAEEVMDHIKSGKEFPEWMQNKLSKLHGQMESLHSALGDHGDDEDMKEAVEDKVYKSGMKKKGYDEVDEISLKDLSNAVAKSTGTKNIKTAMKPGEIKTGLDDLKKRLGTLGKEPQKESTEVDEGFTRVDYKKHGATFAKLRKQAQAKVDKEIDPKYKSTKTLGKEPQKESTEVDEAVRKGAPKMQGDFLKKEREKNRAHDAAMGRTPTGRKKPVRTMTSTQRSLAKLRNEETQIDEISKKTLGLYVKKASADVANRSADNARDYATGNRPIGINKKAIKIMKRQSNINKAVDKMANEAVQSADKKPEKYVKPDGTVGIRMTRTDKKVVDKDA